MANLPPGFVLEGPEVGAMPPPGVALTVRPEGVSSQLPPGFVLEEGGPPNVAAAFDNFAGQAPRPELASAMQAEAERRRTGDGLAMNALAGVNEGLYGTLGAPVDLAAGALNLGIRGANYLTGAQIPTIDNPIGGSRSIAGALGAVGVPDPANVQAGGAGDRLARAAGQGIGYTVGPQAMVGGARAAGAAVNPYLEALLGGMRSGGQLAGDVVAGAAAGAGAQMAGAVAPESVRPLAEMAGGLLGGGAGLLATAVPSLAMQGGRAARDFAAPMSQAGRERLASEALRDAASNPTAAHEALARPGELVPGSQPTTFQQSGDMGLGALERAAAARAPERFQQRRAEQNAARVSQIEGLQPVGSPEAVVTTLRQNLDAIEAATAQRLEAATERARSSLANLGGEGAPESYGATIRQQLADAENAAREAERGLWRAVDPDGTLALDGRSIGQEAGSIASDMARAARPMEGEERAIFDAASRFGGVAPFREITALRSRVSTAMRQELSQNGRSPVYARLTQLRSAIENAIDGAVAGKAAQEAEAVAAGILDPDATMAAVVQGWAENWRAGRAQTEMGAGVAQGAGGYASAGQTAFSPAPRADGQGRGQSRQAAGAQGIPGAYGASPNFDAGAQGRLKAASAATKRRAETYGRGPVADVLRRSGSEGLYNIPASAVPQKVFRPGPRGYDDVMAVRRAVDTPEAMATVRDYAIATMRRAAERPDGALDPNALRIWREKHRDALRAFPEINAMLKAPEQAAEAMATVAAERKATIDAIRSGLVGRLIGVQESADVVRTLGAVFSTEQPVAVMRRLMKETEGNPEARAGVRKALADWMAQRFVSNTEAGTSGVGAMRSDSFQDFIRKNEPALRVAFTAPEMNTLRALAADLQRANRSVASVRLPGGSNTAQDLAAMARTDRSATLLQRLVAGASNAGAGFILGGPTGALAGVLGSEAALAARRAGLQTLDDLIADAMLNPQRAAALLAKAPPKPSRQESINFARRYVGAALVPAAGEFDPEPRR